MAGRPRADLQPAFVLHTYPYSETSLLADAFVRGAGRVVLLAKGARRPRSIVRGLLVSFQPVALAWTGKGEVRTLTRIEWVGGMPLPRGENLLCGFYLNELLMRTIARDDPHDVLFEHYTHALDDLARGEQAAPALRSFEKHLLRELGYAMTLSKTAEGEAIAPGDLYTYLPDRGAVRIPRDRENVVRVHGKTLLDLDDDDFTDVRTQLEAKHLMRHLINHRLDDRPLLSRQVFRDMQNP
ncbi:MAG: DNA repair protein RecO [Burkholderiales bacterium]